MAFVPDCEHDIFVSYAHVDDVPLHSDSKGWVTTLVGCLNTRLSQRLGRRDAYDIWIDSELSKHVSLSSQIMKGLQKTATMVIVLSPAYLASDWCRRERTSFLDMLDERQSSGSRFFLVERDPVTDGDKPREFTDLIGFRFWVPREGKRNYRILGTPEPRKDEREYYDRVDDLTYELEDELRRLRDTGPTGDVSDSGSPAVFLAQVTDDLDLERNGVKRYLIQAGISVVPDTWYPLEPASFRDAVMRDLEKCDLFVQLLSGIPGKKPPDLPQGYAQFQAELAKTVKKRIIQWRSPQLKVDLIEDDDHRAFLEGETVRAEGIEDFKDAIRKDLMKASQLGTTQRASTFVFVNMETSDRPLAEKVCTLLERRGIGYSLPPEQGRPAEVRRLFELNLLTCRGVIIIYGSSTVSWVQRQLLESQKILIQRDSPLPAFAVFDGPPEEKPELGMAFPFLKTIKCRSGFNESELENFLDGIV